MSPNSTSSNIKLSPCGAINAKILEEKLIYDLLTYGFQQISKCIQEMYRLKTNEGDAELEIKDSLNL